MKTRLSMKDIQEKVSVLGRQYGADRIFLFGSYARGTARDDSDVDLRIDREQSLGKKVDLLTTGSLDQEFLTAIKDEEVLLYEHNA